MSDPLFNDVTNLMHFETDAVSDVVADNWAYSVIGAGGGAGTGWSTVQWRYGAGSVAFFSGATAADYEQITTNPQEIDVTQAFTIEFSVYLTSLAQAGGIFLQGTGNQDNRFQMFVTNLGEISLYAATGGAANINTVTTALILTDTWYDIAVTYDGVNTCWVYVNGNPEVSVTGFQNYVSGNDVFRFGLARAQDVIRPTNGYIDEMRITQADRYGGVLYTPAEFPDQGLLAPPTIFLQPTDQFIPDGGDASFLCIAETTVGNLYQQWFLSPSTLLLGEKQPLLEFFDVPFEENGNQYYCIATDDGGSVQSDTVTLNVTGPPLEITSQPASVEVTEGSTATFSVVVGNVTGTANYQWKSDGLNVGTNSSVYTTGPTVAGDDGSIITVEVTDAATFVTSNNAILTVYVPIPYPDGFPCPTWQYGQQTTAFQRRTAFDNGWTRQRRQFDLTGTAIEFSFKVNTEQFAEFNDWIDTNGFNWFDIPLERFGGVKELKTARFISTVQFNYRKFDVIYCTISGEFKDE